MRATKTSLFLLLAYTLPLTAVDLPNLTGTWKQSSTEGPYAKFNTDYHMSTILEITHEEPVLKMRIVTYQKEKLLSEASFEMTTDGKEGRVASRTALPGFMGKTKDKLVEGTVKASWDQRDLVLVTTSSGQTYKMTYKLDPTTGQLMSISTVVMGKQSLVVKYIYDREPK